MAYPPPPLIITGPGAPPYPTLTPPTRPAPPVYPANTQVQGTLSIGSNSLLVAPEGYTCTISLRFNNPIAYDVTLSITRAFNVDPPSTLQCYALTLDAGDTIEDSGYILNPGDEITVDTTTAGTNYFLSISYNYYYRRP